MALVPLNIPAGVVRGHTPLQTKGRYWDSNLIRWRSGVLEPVGGWQRLTSTPLSGPVRTIFNWRTNDGSQYSLLGGDENLFFMDGDSFVDVTPSAFVGLNTTTGGGYGDYLYGWKLYGDDTDATYPRPNSESYSAPFSWSIDNWGEEILAVCSTDGRLLHFEVSEGAAHDAGVSPIQTAVRASNVITITTDGHHGFAVGDSVTVTGNSLSTANGTFTIASVPSVTTFTYSDSGTDDSGTGGTATSVGMPEDNIGVVVTPERHAVLLGSGGNPRRVAWSGSEDYTNWNFSDPTSTAGYLDLDTSSAIVTGVSVREGTLIFTQSEAWLMRYIGTPFIYSISKIGSDCGLMAPRSFAEVAGRCIWMGTQGFWIYDGGVVKPLACDVGNYVFDDMNRESSSVYAHGSANGVFSEAWFWYPSTSTNVPDKYVFYNYQEGWWSIGSLSRTACAGAGVFEYPIATGGQNHVYFQENGWTDAGAPIGTDRYAETGSLNISSGASISYVKQFIPDSGESYDSTAITVYSSFTPEGTEKTSGPYYPRSNGYTDVRASGRDFRLRIESTKDQNWSIGESRFDVSAGGGR